jgi:ankyrin repeat protein
MLIELCTNVDGTDKYGDTPLIFATKENCLTIVSKLILCNANLNAKDKTGNYFSIHLCICLYR